VRPYYLYQCDNVIGVSHFSTSLVRGREIMASLTGFTSGFAVPQYIMATPLGKIDVDAPSVYKEGGDFHVKNYEGKSMNVDTLLPRD
jgi:lysine 2,3-aminomutase